ncbi:MAG: BMC domain-containing protein [Planctomycetia bacterium]|nr:BMC domain-containing protein [Planctomycetia bacterium]
MSTSKLPPLSVGVIELSSIARGYQAQDEMLKSANIVLLLARTICAGKYLLIVGGTVDDVESAIATGLKVAGDTAIDSLVCPRVHESVFQALGQSVILPTGKVPALGIVETFGACAILAASDFAAKAGRVTLIRLHVAMALGGKGLLMLTGSLSDVKSAVKAAADEARRRGVLAAEVVISNPAEELLAEYL